MIVGQVPAQNKYLTNLIILYSQTLGTIKPVTMYGPSVENEKVPGAFLVDQPSKLLNGNINIPMILGVNSGEGGMIAICEC